MCKKCLILTIVFILAVIAGFFVVLNTKAETPFYVVLNEIAWMGSLPEEGETTKQSANDEWIELYNAASVPVDLNGWIIVSSDNSPNIKLGGTLAAQNYLLLSRNNETVNGVKADIVYPYNQESRQSNALSNDGEHLKILDSGENIVDEANFSANWPSGDNTTKQTMERKNPELSGSNPVSWATSVSPGGTPRAINSVYANSNLASPGASEQKTNDDSEQSATDQNTNTANDPANPNTPNQQIVHGAEVKQNENVETSQQINGTTSKDSVLNYSDTASSTNNGDQGLAQIVYPSSIYVNELMPSTVGDDSLEEWIEITNENEESLDISSFKIRDTNGIVNTYTVPTGSIIGANGFLVLSRPTTKITLNNDSDGLEFLKPNGEVVQKVGYEGAKKGFAYTRSDDKWSWSNVPTPGSINILSKPQEERSSAKNVNNDDKSLKKSVKPTKNTNITKTDEPLDTTSTDATLSQKTASLIDSTAELGEAGNGNNNVPVTILALVIAAVSGCAIFILKKRATR